MRCSLAPLLALMLCALLSLQIGAVSHEHVPSDLSYCDFCLQADSSASAFQVGTNQAQVQAGMVFWVANSVSLPPVL